MRFLKQFGFLILSLAFVGVFLVSSSASAATLNCEGVGGTCTSGAFCTDTSRFEATSKTGTSCESNWLSTRCCVPKTTAGACDASQCKTIASCAGNIDVTKSCSGASDICCIAANQQSCPSGICMNDEGSCTGGVDTSGSCPGQVCCKAPSSGTTCSGKDMSGKTQTGSCSTSATCSSGTALTEASGCASGRACCSSTSSSGKCTDQGGECALMTDCDARDGWGSLGAYDCQSSGTNWTCCKKDDSDGTPGTVSCTGSENAGIVPCGRSCDNPNTADVNEAAVCTLCHLLVLMRNITDWIFMVMTYIAFAVLVAMGILYIISTGKPQLIGMAKNGIWAALVGFAIVLLGWVAINVLLFVLADGALGADTANFSVKTNGKWFEYKCDTQTKYTGTGGTGSGGTTPTGPGGNLSCTSGACAKDSTISNAVKSQSYVDSNMYMAVLQAGEHYNQNTTCTKGVSGAGACGYSQVIPSTARAVCGLTCSEIIADVNKDIGCGAKVLADFKKYSMCNLDGIKSLSGCYNSGTSNCTPNSRTINGKCYSCGEGTPPYCDRVSAYYEACK